MIPELVDKNIHFLNSIQAYHWQTKSYSEHNAFGEFYTKFNTLNDRLVETWQGQNDKKVTFTGEYQPNILNYSGLDWTLKLIREHRQLILDTAFNLHADDIDIHSILEDMKETVNELLFHLQLK